MRWALAAVILMVAGVVAIWPRTDEQPAPEGPTTSAADLTRARADAALPACATGGAGPADLRGLTAQCLADGAPVDLAEAVTGPVLVNVWATWCQPCREELPVLARYAGEPDAIDVVTLGVESRPEDALALLTALDVRLPSLLDEDDEVRERLRAVALPASYLVGADGSVRLVENPRLFRTVDEVRQAVANG